MQESPVVWISPIVAHLPNGYDITEVGIGGGGDDLEREAELDGFSADEAQTLIETYAILTRSTLPPAHMRIQSFSERWHCRCFEG